MLEQVGALIESIESAKSTAGKLLDKNPDGAISLDLADIFYKLLRCKELAGQLRMKAQVLPRPDAGLPDSSEYRLWGPWK